MADPYLLYGGYGLGHYGYGLGHYGYGHGLYYGKREAEAEPKAEAEPYYGYYGLGYHGLGYRTYGYGHGLYYGKREAEAEPKAAAEPYYATTDWATMDLATGPTATAMDFTTARGRLRLSPRPLLIPTCCTVATGPTAMAT